MSVLVFVVLILLLYLSSIALSVRLGQFLYRLTGSRQLSVWLLAVLFLPGTLIHELSHLLVATLLGVRSGAIDLIPQPQEGRIIMGSIPIASTDRIRRALIGAAPFFVGIGLLLLIAWWLTTSPHSWPEQLLAAYFSLQIGSTCFASSKDLEGSFELLAALIFILLVLYLLGFSYPVDWVTSFVLSRQATIWQLNRLLTLPVLVNLATLGMVRLLPR